MLIKIIFRVDDRLVHGQVIEGWVRHYKIRHVLIINNKIMEDSLQQVIYSSILPLGCKLDFYSKEDFKTSFKTIKVTGYMLVLFENIADLYEMRDLLNEKIYINIGCLASREHKIQISDTVFLNMEELRLLSNLRKENHIYIKKLPWDTNIEIKNFFNHLIQL